MDYPKTAKFSFVLLACLSLSACFGSSSGSGASGGAGTGGAGSGGSGSGGSGSGGSGGGSGGSGSGSGGAGSGGSAGGGSTFQSSFDAANLQPPTQTALSGSADYTGEISVRTNANAADADEVLIGDLDMNVNFNAGATRPITASATNFAGEIDGTAVTATGTLSTANAPNGVNAVSTTNLNIPGAGATTFTGLSTELRGTLSEPTDNLSGAVIMTLQGDMRGTNGAAVAGANGVSIEPTGGGASIITGGTWYADRD